MNKFRKLIALLLTVIMFVGVLPMNALAAVIVATDTSESKQISVLAIKLEPENPQVHYKTFVFHNGKNEVDRQIVKNDDTLYAPTNPTAEDGKKFIGWFTQAGTEFTAFGKQTVGEQDETVDLYAKFEQVYYVFFHDDGGRIVATKETKTGESVSTDDVSFAVDSQHSITGWYTDSKYTGEPVDDSITVNETNVDLYAKVEEGNWVTFEANGGSYTAPVFVHRNHAVTEPATTRAGYKFDGWYIDKTTKYDFTQKVENPLTLEAHWTAQQVDYTVIYWKENADDDNYSFAESETQKGTAGTQTTLTAGKYKYSGFTLDRIEQQTINGDGSTIVNVYYKREVYDVKFYVYEEYWDYEGYFPQKKGRWVEDAAKRITAKYGANISDKWPGGGWYVDKNGNKAQSNIDTMPLNGKNFYGQQSGQKQHTAYYYVESLDGKYVPDHTDVAFTGRNGRLTVTEEDQYPITGFTFNKENSTQIGSNYNGAKFYYTRNSYDLVFVSGGKKLKTEKVKYEAPLSGYNFTPAVTPTGKEGFTFGGWYDNEQCAGAPFDFNGKTMPADNVTVYAKWVPETYKVTIEYVNAVGKTETKTVNSGSLLGDAGLPSEITPAEGYEWTGSWLIVEGTTEKPANLSMLVMKNITLRPQMVSKAEYKVTYDLNGGAGSVTDDNSYAKGAYAEVRSADGATAPEGKKFLYWEDEAGNRYYKGKKVEITGNVTLKAVWGGSAQKVQVTYHSNFGKDSTQTYGEQPNNSTITILGYDATGLPTREGYEFAGWNTSADGMGSSFAAGTTARLVGEKDNDLYARWRLCEYKYTVEYYYDGVQDTDATVSVEAEFNSVIEEYPLKPKEGYKFSKHENVPLTIDTDTNKNVIKVYYVKDDSQTQTTTYTVKYTIEKVEQPNDGFTVSGTAWVNDNPAQIAIAEGGIPAPAGKYTGYKLDPDNPEYPAAGTKVNSGNVYTVNYVKDDSQTQPTAYTVKYTIEKVEKPNDGFTVSGKAWVNDNPAKIAIAEGGIPAPADKYPGYKLDPNNPKYPEAGTMVDSGNVYTVNYVKDDSQTQPTAYTVKYTIEKVEKPNDGFTVSGKAWVNDNPAKIAIAEGGIPAPADKYPGYKLDPNNPKYPEAGTMVDSGNVYTVNYVKDDSQTQPTAYTVKYTIEKVEKPNDGFTVSGTAWINDKPAKIAIAEGGIPAPADKYTGYKLDPNNPKYPEAGTMVDSGNVYTVNYVKDDSQTQPTAYTVKYTIEKVEKPNDGFTVSGTAWINDNPAKIAIEEGGIPAPADKYTGYKLDPENPEYPEAGKLVASGSEYIVNYVKDDSQTKKTEYKVRYTIEGVEQENDGFTVSGTAWINDDPAKIAIEEGGIPAPADKYTGYELDPNNPKYPEAGTMVNSDSVYTVNYVKDDSQTKKTEYKVRYTIEGVEQENDGFTVSGTAWVNDNPAQIAIAEGGIPAPADKYTGYKLDPENPEYPEAGKLVAGGSEYIVNYVKDDSQTHTVGYTVEYYKDNVHDADADVSETKSGWIGDAVEVEVKEVNTKDKFVGYKFEKTDPTEVPGQYSIKAFGDDLTNVIKVYYVKRTDLSYTVNYLEKDTNKELKEPKTVGNQTFEAVIKAEDEKIDIDGYKYDSVDKDTLTIGVEKNELNFYYTKNSYTLTIHYRYYADGTAVAPDYVGTFAASALYNIPSPVRNGYIYRTHVRGVMPEKDYEEWVYYYIPGGGEEEPEKKPEEKPEENPKTPPREVTTLLDYPTPLGLNNVFMNVGDCFE